MEEARYWCHMCSQMVDPIMEVETIKCPFCQSGFVEEMGSDTHHHHDHHHPTDFGGGSDSDRALSLWAPIFLSMTRTSNPRRRRRRLRHLEFEEDDDERQDYNEDNDETQLEILDREMTSNIRRRMRSTAAIRQLLQGIQARNGTLSESENSERDARDRDGRDNNDAERVILINPFNQTIIVQGSYGLNGNNSSSSSQNPLGSLGDYFVGPGLDLLLQHLAENDPNRYGTPPAQKEAVEAMPTVKIEENLQCWVCLEDFEIGAEAKEMPCKHRFHSGCILPWLELHSCCPVCRHQLPSDEDESKLDSEGSRNNGNHNHSSGGSGGEEGDGDGRSGSERRFSVALPWPFSSLFSSSSGSQTTNANSSSTASNAPENASHTDEN